MKKLLNVLYAHPIAQMPPDIVKLKNKILTTVILTTIVLDILTFSVKGAQLALAANMKPLAFALIVLYFIRSVVNSSVQTFSDSMKGTFDSENDKYINENVSHVSDVVRGKVFQKKGEFSLIMTNAEIVLTLKEFIGYVWEFWKNFPIVISNSITAFVMAITILITEFIQTGNFKLTLLFSGVLFFCVFVFGVLFKIRLNVKREFRDEHRKLRKEDAVLANDVKNIEPLIKKEFSFRVNLYKNNKVSMRSLEKKELFKLDTLYVMRTLVLALFMMFIIAIKVHFSGGIANISEVVITDILAISAIYSNILDKVANILSNFENLSNTLRDAEKVKVDVDNIMDIYDKECSMKFVNVDTISKITVDPFEFTYPGDMSVYKLRNPAPFELKLGNSYLVHGHTGCGKSTFMHLLIGKIRMDVTPISYGESCEKAYLSSIMHESNGRLGSNPILQELIFSQDVSQLDSQRLIEILHGTHIYEEVMRNLGLTFPDDKKVLEYLNSTTTQQYSTGQKQRLAIVKVLYNLTNQHQIVVFDEATNALDDTIAFSVLKFVSEYCQRDIKRIVLFVSHQVKLTEKLVDGKITFVSHTFPVFDIQPELHS